MNTALKPSVLLELHDHLPKCLYECMYIATYLTHGNVFGAFKRNGNTTRAMFTYRDEFFELEIEVKGSKIFLTTLAATESLIHLEEMMGKRLSNYVKKRVTQEELWASLGVVNSPKRRSGRLYMKRCGEITDDVHKRNMSLAMEHNLQVNFAERLTGYNIKLGCKA